jgi:hypothetical protein
LCFYCAQDLSALYVLSSGHAEKRQVMKARTNSILFIGACLGLIAAACSSTRSPRGYVYHNQKTERGYGAYAYVLLSSKSATSSGAKYARLLQTANSFIENFPPSGNRISTDEKKSLMVTHWLLQNNKLPDESATSLVANYDYARSLEMLTAIKMAHKEGPVLVAWQKPFEELESAEIKKSLVFDMSRFSDEDIDRAFRLWRKMLSEDVDDWNKPGNKLIKFREEVRNGFQQYGQTLFDLISIIY